MRSRPPTTCASSWSASWPACRWRRCWPGSSTSRPRASSARRALPVAATDPPEDSIAVLPFANLSNEPENEYFSDGLAEEIRNQLARVQGLRVAARSSSFAFKGRHEDVRDIGRRLNVASVLEGGVRKQAGTVRIDVQLVSAVDGYQVWAESFERQIDDIFKLQTEVACAVIAAVRPRTSTAERPQLESVDTEFRRVQPVPARTPPLPQAYRGVPATGDGLLHAGHRARSRPTHSPTRVSPTPTRWRAPAITARFPSRSRSQTLSRPRPGPWNSHLHSQRHTPRWGSFATTRVSTPSRSRRSSGPSSSTRTTPWPTCGAA